MTSYDQNNINSRTDQLGALNSAQQGGALSGAAHDSESYKLQQGASTQGAYGGSNDLSTSNVGGTTGYSQVGSASNNLEGGQQQQQGSHVQQNAVGSGYGLSGQHEGHQHRLNSGTSDARHEGRNPNLATALDASSRSANDSSSRDQTYNSSNTHGTTHAGILGSEQRRSDNIGSTTGGAFDSSARSEVHHGSHLHGKDDSKHHGSSGLPGSGEHHTASHLHGKDDSNLHGSSHTGGVSSGTNIYGSHDIDTHGGSRMANTLGGSSISHPTPTRQTDPSHTTSAEYSTGSGNAYDQAKTSSHHHATGEPKKEGIMEKIKDAVVPGHKEKKIEEQTGSSTTHH